MVNNKKISSDEFKLLSEKFYDLFTDNIPNDLDERIHDKIIDLGNLLTTEIEKGNLWATIYATVLIERYLPNLLEIKIPELEDVTGRDYLNTVAVKVLEHTLSGGYWSYSGQIDEAGFREDLVSLFTYFRDQDYLNKVLEKMDAESRRITQEFLNFFTELGKILQEKLEEEYSCNSIISFYAVVKDLKGRFEVAQKKLGNNSPPPPVPDSNDPVPSPIKPPPNSSPTEKKQTEIKNLEDQIRALERKNQELTQQIKNSQLSEEEKVRKRRQIDNNNKLKDKKVEEVDKLKKETTQNPQNNNTSKVVITVLVIALIAVLLLWFFSSRKRKNK